MAGCGAVCYEVDPESVQTEEKLVYAGAGRGSYQQVSSMEMVGRGRGDFEKEKAAGRSGWRQCMPGHRLHIPAHWLPEQLVADTYASTNQGTNCSASTGTRGDPQRRPVSWQ
eukprot:g17692.t1